MQHTVHTCRPKLGTWLALFTVVALLLSGFAQPGAQAAPEAPQASPNQPALVSPANEATGVMTPPTLSVTVTDPESDPMTVRFYGRAKSAPTPDFRIIAIPDSQNLAQSYPSVMYSQFQWIADQKTAQNIVFATSLGDIVNTASSTAQWTVADTSYDYLDAASVSYSVGPGNHDLGTLYTTNFGPSRFTGKSYYGGSYDSTNYDNYSLFSISGMDFILINTRYNASSAVLNWVDARLKEHPDRRGIFVQHDILNVNNTFVNQNSYNALKDNPNLFMMLCGHMHTSSDGSAYRAELGDDGHTIHILMTDYQDYNNSSNTGYLRILRFSPANDNIYAQVYSPYINGYLTNAGNYEEFAMAYDLAGAPAFELIGTVTGVASGGTASISWPGRVASTAYEWYVEVTDGSSPTTTGPTWSFTAGVPMAKPKAPIVTAIAIAGDGAKLTWNPVTQDINNNPTTISKYQLYGSQSPYFTPSGTPLGEPTATEFTHGGGPTDTTNWYYVVRAVNVIGPSDDSARRTGRFGFTLAPGSAP